MKKNISIFFAIMILLMSPILIFAKGRSYGLGGTHNVRSHVKRNGTVIMQHRAANPRAGVRCKNNICY